MKKYEVKRLSPSTNRLFPILILIATVFMGVGYASINSIIINVGGEVVSKTPDGIFITEVKYVSDVNANLDESRILNAYQTNLSSVISLSDTDENSSITYQVILYNSNDIDYYFYNTNYLVDDSTYSNENISFQLDGLSYNTKIGAKSYLTFNITFYYSVNDINNIDNQLNSIINFNFVEATSYELQSIHGDYSLTTTCNAGDECKNMTVNNFIISVDEIVIPEPAYGLMTFTKSYDASTGLFKIVRSKLTGQNFITYSGSVHMLSNPILIASQEGSYSISIDCSSVENYKMMTVDDFYYEIDWLSAPEAPYSADSELNGVDGTIVITKTYNSNTGILNIVRSSIKGTGTVRFAVNVYIAG